jgi:ferritin heavy chain
MTFLWNHTVLADKSKTQMTNWNIECENVVNEQIQLEYWASYQYHIIWSYFDRNDVGISNIAEFFRKNSVEEREHAEKFMSYQNLRGGKVTLNGVQSVDLSYLDNMESNNDVLASFEKALEMENIIYTSLINVHKTSEKYSDPQFGDFVEGEFLKEQVHAISEITKYISQLKRIGNDGHGLWNFNEKFKNI